MCLSVRSNSLGGPLENIFVQRPEARVTDEVDVRQVVSRKPGCQELGEPQPTDTSKRLGVMSEGLCSRVREGDCVTSDQWLTVDPRSKRTRRPSVLPTISDRHPGTLSQEQDRG